MKKTIALILLIMFASLTVFANPSQNVDWDQEYRMITFIVNDVVYAGFSPALVNSFIPVKTGFDGPITFSSTGKGTFHSDLFYVYCLSSTKAPVKVQWGDTYSGDAPNNSIKNTIVAHEVTMSNKPVLKSSSSGADSSIPVTVIDADGNPVANFGPFSMADVGKPFGNPVQATCPYVWCAGPYMIEVKESDIPANAKGTYNLTLYLQVVVTE